MRKQIAAFTVMVFCILALGACAAEPRYTGIIQMFGYGEEADVPPVVYIENDHLRLDFLTQTAEIIVTEKRSGATWRSSPYGAGARTDAMPVVRAHMQSLFLLEFENENAHNQTFDTYRFSVQDQTFEHAIVDGALEVYFTVGNLPRIFFVPLAVYEERFNYFIDQLDDAQRRQIQEAYRLLDINRLRPADNRSELLEQFPTLEDYRIFVLRDNIRDFLLERIQDWLFEVGYTIEDWESDMAYFGLETYQDRPAFNLTMRFELDRNQMVVSVPFNSISFMPDFLPTHLTVMPFFGAGGPEDEGYVFVPDGSGAIIHFNNGRGNQQANVNNVFGWDGAIVRPALVHDNRAPFPVFGVHHDTGGTFAAIIEQGASYASVRAEVSGVRGPYNMVHPTFRLFHGAIMDITGRSDRDVVLHQRALPDESIVIRYVFTEQPGYVGMAVAFREFMQERFPWLNNRVTEPVGAMVEILGAVETTQSFLGIPVSRPVPLTTFEQATGFLDDFDDMGWRNLHIRMLGLHNDSIDHSIPRRFNIISQLGSRREFNNLLDTAERHGFAFYAEADFVHMRGSGRGFSRNRDAARQTNRDRAEHAGHSHVHFGALSPGAILADPLVVARPRFTMDITRNFVEDAANRGVNNISFRSMASVLSSDFCERYFVSREESMHMRMDLLSELRGQGTGIWLNYGFSYAIPFADIVTSIPLTDQNFSVTCSSVPFFQIALHGLVHFAGRPLNLSEDYSYHLLRSVESGSSLFFSFKDARTYDIRVPNYRRYFANEYQRWIYEANRLYHSHRDNFAHLYNQLITDHRILADGVSVTVYEDGTRVYVNVSRADFEAEGVRVPARRYTVVRSGSNG